MYGPLNGHVAFDAQKSQLSLFDNVARNVDWVSTQVLTLWSHIYDSEKTDCQPEKI